MAPMKWDAYRSLNIIRKDYISMTCLGSDRHEKCCHREIPEENIRKIHDILGELEAKAPIKAISSLKRLAKLSLCTQCHRRHAPGLVQEWDDAIQDATKLYEKGLGLKVENEALKERIARLKDKKRELKDEREELQGRLEQEMLRREQELNVMGMVLVMKFSELMDAANAEQEATFQNIMHQLQNYVRGVETLNAQLLAEQQTTSDLRQSLQTATDDLIGIEAQLKKSKEECSHYKRELEKLQVEFVTTRDMLDEEKGILDVQHAESLARMDELIQELAYAKLHPFKTFFMGLVETISGWGRSVLTCFGKVRSAAFGQSSLQETVPSP